MPKNAISGIVITFNEEKNIEECLNNLKEVCNELVVVDSNSTDNTRAIAERCGAKVVTHPYIGDGLQKNLCLEHVTNKWVLSLDADERLTPEMIEAINNLDLANSSFEGYAFRRRNYIGSRWIKRCGWYPDWLIRLYNHDNIKFKEVREHASVVSNNYQKLNADIIHFTYPSVDQLFAKTGRNFSYRGAKIMYQKGKKCSSFSPILHGVNAFIRKYFFKLGFLGGLDGLSISLSTAMHSYLKYALLLELYRDEKVRKNTDLNKYN